MIVKMWCIRNSMRLLGESEFVPYSETYYKTREEMRKAMRVMPPVLRNENIGFRQEKFRVTDYTLVDKKAYTPTRG